MIPLLILFVAADLASIKSEANIERRSELALDYANQSIDSARDGYNSGDMAKVQAALSEMNDAIEVAYQALSEVKNPRGNKYVKRAELRTRELVRRLDGLAQTVNFEDREPVSKARDHAADIRDNLLNGIMSKKK